MANASGRNKRYAALLELSMKRCTCCKTIKPLDEYSPRSSFAGDLAPRANCKSCCSAKVIALRGTDYWQVKKLKKYGLTQEAFNLQVIKQNGLCAICKCEPDVFRIDHCHKTGKTRELLCFSCNVALGHLRDDVSILESAIQYLRRHDIGK